MKTLAETLLLIFIAGKIGNIAQDKGRSRVGYGLLTALLWFVGEIGLGVVGYNIGGDFLSAVPFGIAGAAIGAIVSYLIVSNLSETEEHKVKYTSRYSGGYAASPAPEKKPAIDERTEDEKEEDDFAASVGLSALQDDDE